MYTYSETNLGCIYLVPVHTYITTQDDFFEVHVSSHNKKKELIDAGDYEKGKHQNPHLRKPSKSQDISVRKKENMTGWARATSTKSDAELQKEVQDRFIKLGGVGTVSPKKAVDLCGSTTTFFNKNESAGVKSVSYKNRQRWNALPCHGHHGKRAASAVFDEQPYKRLRPCG